MGLILLNYSLLLVEKPKVFSNYFVQSYLVAPFLFSLRCSLLRKVFGLFAIPLPFVREISKYNTCHYYRYYYLLQFTLIQSILNSLNCNYIQKSGMCWITQVRNKTAHSPHHIYTVPTKLSEFSHKTVCYIYSG